MSVRRHRIAATIFCAVVLPISLAISATEVPARQPLTYKDSGIYGWWQPYFWEGPFDFIITQAIVLPGDFGTPGTNNASDLEHIKLWNDSLMKARAAGKRVLVVVSPGQGRPYTEDYYRGLEQFLDHVNNKELYAISLGEENISAGDWVKALSDFYHRLKKRYPDLPVYQWYTSSGRADARPGFKWPLLPSDGWLSDEYVATPDDFEQAIRRYRMLGLPFVNIMWASPFYSSSKQTSVPYDQYIFDGQLRVSQKYDVPTAFFCWDGLIGRAFPWDQNGKQENKDLFKTILEIVKQSKALPSESLLDWDSANRPVVTVLEKQSDGSFSYRESYDLWDGGPNHRPPVDDFMSRSQIRGLRAMKWTNNPSGIVVRSDGQHPTDASILNRWVAPAHERLHFTATARIIVDVDAKPDLIFEVSPNGYDWIAKSTSIDQDNILKVELPEASPQVYTRLRISSSDASRQVPLATIDWIEVSGVEVH